MPTADLTHDDEALFATLARLPVGMQMRLVGAAATARQVFRLAGVEAAPQPASAARKLPDAASRTAMELNAWLTQLLAMILDREEVSPASLNKHLQRFRGARPAVKHALDRIRVPRGDGKELSGLDVLADLLADPRRDPVIEAAGGADAAARHAAFDLLCARRAAMAIDLMHRVCAEITGDDEARPREYDDADAAVAAGVSRT